MFSLHFWWVRPLSATSWSEHLLILKSIFLKSVDGEILERVCVHRRPQVLSIECLCLGPVLDDLVRCHIDGFQGSLEIHFYYILFNFLLFIVYVPFSLLIFGCYRCTCLHWFGFHVYYPPISDGLVTCGISFSSKRVYFTVSPMLCVCLSPSFLSFFFKPSMCF